MKKLDKMSVEELEAEKRSVAEQVEALMARKRELARAIDARLTEEAVQRKLNAMTDTERAALAQMVAARGIEEPK